MIKWNEPQDREMERINRIVVGTRRRRRRTAILSLFVAGLGQLTEGRVWPGLFFMGTIALSIWMVRIIWKGPDIGIVSVGVGWAFLWTINVIDAWKGATLPTAPCQDACPLGLDVPTYLALTASGRFSEALALVRRETPFPGVLGRICDHPCEFVCTRSGIDNALAIMHIKRFLADADPVVTESPAGKRPSSPRDVAVIGAGPAGLSAAWHLTQRGYGVMVYEAAREPGGLMGMVIPEFRLPLDVVRGEISVIERSGVEIKCGVKIGETLAMDGLMVDFKAVLIATGMPVGRSLSLEGAPPEAIIDGMQLLMQLKRGDIPPLGRNILVIGGGNTALDVALSLKRLENRHVRLVYRRRQCDMPAHEWSILEATAEGIEIVQLRIPIAVVMDGQRITGITVLECAFTEDAEGKIVLAPIEGTESLIEGETIVAALGQQSDIQFLAEIPNLKTNEDGTIWTDPKTLATTVDGIFAAGDIVTGPSSVVQAMAAGCQAARSIDAWLRRSGSRPTQPPWIDLPYHPPIGAVEDAAWSERRPRSRDREPVPMLDSPLRVDSFREVIGPYTEEQARRECKRCLRCGQRYSL
jgi:NADPH-dependent glutamate synthase beta subunit-like oxidoreductase